MSSLRRLEQENQEAAERLQDVVRRGEGLLEQIQAALADIVQCQLDMASADPAVLPWPSEPDSSDIVHCSSQTIFMLM